MFRKAGLYLFLLVLVFTTSCKTISYEWGNFTAYYNTFYNAKSNFEKGFEATLKSQPLINSEKTIRITESPNKSGFTDYEKSIEKGAKILREYDKTKWIDDALLLIGKAYYYQMNYFSAEEKFIELYANTSDIKLKREAIFHLALVKFDLKKYDEALSFIDEELNAIDIVWTKESRALVNLVKAEIYTESKDYYKANQLLEQTLPFLKSNLYRARGWYLNGQLLERLNENQKALTSYLQVQNHTAEYTLLFLAKRKQAEIARSEKRFNQALVLFTDMSKDGKNYDILSDLNYEIGKTLELKKDFQRAESIYKDVLYNKIKIPSKETAAKSYYGLGIIAKDFHRNLPLAAQYFDSAKTKGANSVLLPEWFNATELASHYGDFSKLNKKNRRFDSLLYLSELTKTQLDSVILTLQNRRKAEIEALKKEQDKRASTIVIINTSPTGGQNGEQESGNQSQNGFLNHKNPTVVQQLKDQFFAYWGNRPLVDNWRRYEAIKNVIVNSGSATTTQKKAASNPENASLQQLKIDLSEIPFDSTKKATMRQDLATSLYETGNIFYLSLNQVDSAKVYYYRVLNEFPETKIIPQTKYTLTEILNNEDQFSAAKTIAQQIVTDYPTSIYTPILIEKFSLLNTDSTKNSSTINQETLSTLIKEAQLNPSIEKAETIRKISIEQKDNEKASNALYLSAIIYVEKAKQAETFRKNFNVYQENKLTWKSKETAFKLLKDSLRVQLKDSTILADSLLSRSYKSIIDSTISKPTFEDNFPYLGAEWDSTRVILDLIRTKYALSTIQKKAEILRQELSLPQGLVKKAPVLLDSTKVIKQPILDENSGD